MSYLTDYKEYIKYKGITSSNNHENRMLDKISHDWNYSNPSARKVKVVRTDVSAAKVRVQTFKKTVGFDRVYVHPKDKLYSGDIIKNLQERSWIVIETSLRAHLFQIANIVPINRILKWQSNGVVYEQMVEVKPFSRVQGTKDFFFFTEPEDVLNILFPNNLKLKTIQRDQRFIIDDTPYKVTKFSRTKYLGVTVIYIKEDMGSPDDTDNIADYIEPDEVSITDGIIGKNEIIYGFSETYQLRIDDEIVEAEWNIETQLNWVTLKTNEMNAEISIERSLEHIGKVFELTAKYEGKIYSITILIRSLM